MTQPFNLPIHLLNFEINFASEFDELLSVQTCREAGGDD